MQVIDPLAMQMPRLQFIRLIHHENVIACVKLPINYF